MKIPVVLMAGLMAVSVSAQNTKTVVKAKKPVKKVKKSVIDTSGKPKPATPKVITKKDTLERLPYNCPACGMG